MHSDRRDFLKAAGAAGAIAATGAAVIGHGGAAGAATPGRGGVRGMARNLTLLTMKRNGELRLGVKTEHGVLDVKDAAAVLHLAAPMTMDDLLQHEDGPSLNALVDAAVKSGAAKKSFVALEAVEYGPLVSRPEKIVCVGLNYRKHAAETKMPIPKAPVLFNKFNNSLAEHRCKLKLPPAEVATKFDYEVELVIVIGKEAKNVSEADALQYVAGYATGNDFSARDLQLETGGQWMIGKTLDQFAPIGPYLVTADQVDPDKLKIECRVNGEVRQSSNTSDLIFNTRQMVSYISNHFTLRPGDIIFTGTPEGVVLGKPADKRVWLKAGDKVACSLEKLGELTFDLV